MAEARKRILLVEDESNLAFHLQFNLQAEGFEVTPAVDGQIAIDKFDRQGPFDLIILDVMLPEKNGFQVAEYIRAKDDQTQILMLTALGQEEDRIRGFKAGIDDYVTKPFHLPEFLLRVKRMIRRAQHFSHVDLKVASSVITCGVFTLNTELNLLKTPNGEVNLTALEADVLREFMLHPNRVLSRQELLDSVWGVKGDIETRTVDNFIARLRKYIELDPTDPKHLLSVRGRGYRFVES